MKRLLLIVTAVVLAVATAAIVPPLRPFLILFYGWLTFPIHTLGRAGIEESAILVALGALVVMAALAHRLTRWLYASMWPEQAARQPWRLRWTMDAVYIVILLFGAGICMIVIVHESAWLATAKEPWSQAAPDEQRLPITVVGGDQLREGR